MQAVYGRRPPLHLAGVGCARSNVARQPQVGARAGGLPAGWAEGTPLASQRITAQDLVRPMADLDRIRTASRVPDMELLTAFHQPSDFAAYLAEIRTNIDRVDAWARDRHVGATLLPKWADELLAKDQQPVTLRAGSRQSNDRREPADAFADRHPRA